MAISLLRIVAVFNFLFIMVLSDIRYDIYCPYIPNEGLFVIFLILLFGLTLLDYSNLYKNEVQKQLSNLMKLLSLVSATIMSSFIFLVPRIINLEMRYQDTIKTKFIVVKRIWSEQEYEEYVNSYLLTNNYSNLISYTDRNSLIKNSSSMAELKDSLRALILSKLESKNYSIFSFLANWASENPAEALASIAIGVLAGTLIIYWGSQFFVTLDTQPEVSQQTIADRYVDINITDIDLNVLEKGIRYAGNLMLLLKKKEEYDKFMGSLESLSPEELTGIKFMLEQFLNKETAEKSFHNWGLGTRLGGRVKDLIDKDN